METLCNVCGSSEMTLVDGFYYCVECGTQDINVRETIIEEKIMGDGNFATTTKKRLTNVVEQKVTMPAEWYKWHAFNFILAGLADELIALGAKPSFKRKLLWIWIRYVKKFQNKEELGLQNDDKESEHSKDEKDDDIEEIDKAVKSKGCNNPFFKLETINKRLFVTMIYIALNIDKSDIQLRYLLRFLQEGRTSYPAISQLVPKDIESKKIPEYSVLVSLRGSNPESHALRALAMTCFRQLNLGSPVLPDIRKLLDNYMSELCLPNDLKPLVLSLMVNYTPYTLELDIDVINNVNRKVPEYEVIVMSFILVALKICFGFDDEYEVRLSDVVDKINDRKNLHKSHNFGFISDPSDRLFSFREWANYLYFRRKMLSRHCKFMFNEHFLDMDDYVYMEHTKDLGLDGKVYLKDELAQNIIEKLQPGDVSVIPKSKFPVTFTPYSSYTKVIVEHLNDPEVKLLLSEDFTQYSLSYAWKTRELIDPDTSENVICGINMENKTKSEQYYIGSLLMNMCDQKMVYVKNCENRNWLKTKAPKAEHMIIKKDEEDNEKLMDHCYVSNVDNLPSQRSDVDESENEKCNNENEFIMEISDKESTKENISEIEKTTNEIEDKSDIDIDISMEMIKDEHSDKEATKEVMNDESDRTDESNDDQKLEFIREEEEDKNIFDDDFNDLDVKKETIEEKETNEFEMYENYENNFEYMDKNEDIAHEEPEQKDDENNDSEVSSVNSLYFNPDTFNRNKAIKDLIIHACTKYKIPIPSEYRTKESIKRKRCLSRDVIRINTQKPKRAKVISDEKVSDLLATYYNHIEKDIINQVSQQVKSAIQNLNQTKEEIIEPEQLDGEPWDSNLNEINNQSVMQMDNTEQNTADIDRDEDEDVINDKIFSEGSDEEVDLDKLLPKSHPKFDENLYDVDQLYVKVRDQPEDLPGDVSDDPELLNIVDKKIEAVKKDKSILNRKPIKKEVINHSDSEEDLPLNVLKEKMVQDDSIFEFTEIALDEHLIPGGVPKFYYWTKHYENPGRNMTCRRWFETELTNGFPKSFHFVINEFANIVDSTAFNLYRKMQYIERHIIKMKRLNK